MSTITWLVLFVYWFGMGGSNRIICDNNNCVGTILSCNNDAFCELSCETDGSCKDVILKADNVNFVNISCIGSNSCNNMTININITDTSFIFNMDCMDAFSCNSIKIQTNSLENMEDTETVLGTQMNINCMNNISCNNVTLSYHTSTKIDTCFLLYNNNSSKWICETSTKSSLDYVSGNSGITNLTKYLPYIIIGFVTILCLLTILVYTAYLVVNKRQQLKTNTQTQNKTHSKPSNNNSGDTISVTPDVVFIENTPQLPNNNLISPQKKHKRIDTLNAAENLPLPPIFNPPTSIHTPTNNSKSEELLYNTNVISPKGNDNNEVPNIINHNPLIYQKAGSDSVSTFIKNNGIQSLNDISPKDIKKQDNVKYGEASPAMSVSSKITKHEGMIVSIKNINAEHYNAYMNNFNNGNMNLDEYNDITDNEMDIINENTIKTPHGYQIGDV